MQLSRARQSLGGNGLDYITCDDVFFECRNISLISFFADIGCGRVPESYGLLRYFRGLRAHHGPRKAADLGYGRLVGEREVRGCRILRAKDMRDDLDILEEVIVYEQRVGEHEDGLRDSQSVFQWPRRLGLKMLDRIVRDIANGAAGERGHLGNLHVFVDGQLALEGEHGIALDGVIGPYSDQLERIGAYKTVSCDVLACQHRLEQKAVFRVVGDAEIGDDGCDKVCGELDVHRDAIAAFLVVNQTFDVLERGECRQHLGVHDSFFLGIVLRPPIKKYKKTGARLQFLRIRTACLVS